MSTKTTAKPVLKEPAKRTSDIGFGTVGMLDITDDTDLNVDEDYQRALKLTLIQEISNEWSDEAAGIVIISERDDGSYWIVDGQHRIAAAKILNKTAIPALFVKDHTQEMEAMLRLRTGARKTETAGERMKAMLAANIPEALGLLRVCRKHNIVLALDSAGPEYVGGVSSLQKMYNLDKGQTLDETLAVLGEAYGETGFNKYNLPVRLLWAVRWFLETHKRFDRKRFTTILRQNQTAIRSKGEKLRVQMGGSLWVATYRTIVEMYNDGLAKDRQLKAETKGATGAGHMAPTRDYQ